MKLKKHDLKTYPIYFKPVVDGRKKFEYRYNDRGFKVGDLLQLREWCPERRAYTGKLIVKKITYILEIENSKYVVLSIDDE